MSRNMCKLHHKVRNGQHLPTGNPNFRNIFDDWKSLSQIKIIFLPFQKTFILNKNTLRLLSSKKLFLKIFLIWLPLFQLLILQHTAPCTLHSVHYTLHLHQQMPLNLNLNVHFVLPIKNCTVHNTGLYCILQIYHIKL